MSENISEVVRQLAESSEPLIYRLAAFFMMSVLDDPAMLALAFC